MCGRYSLAKDSPQILQRYHIDREFFDFRKRYNVAPSQMMPVIWATNGKRDVQIMRWGLIPFWSKDPSSKFSTINARVESVLEKPTYRQSVRQRRCLVPADGYYEWRVESSKKQPFRITQDNDSIITFAGIWDTWKPGQGDPVTSFSILTTAAEGAVAQVHDRMPVVLTKEEEAAWISPECPVESMVHSFVKKKGSPDLRYYKVDRSMNRPAVDSPMCFEPLAEATAIDK